MLLHNVHKDKLIKKYKMSTYIVKLHWIWDYLLSKCIWVIILKSVKIWLLKTVDATLDL